MSTKDMLLHINLLGVGNGSLNKSIKKALYYWRKNSRRGITQKSLYDVIMTLNKKKLDNLTNFLSTDPDYTESPEDTDDPLNKLYVLDHDMSVHTPKWTYVSPRVE